MYGAQTLEPGDVDQKGNRYPQEKEFNEAMDKLADDLNRQNIVYIHGTAYEVASYGPPYSDGSRHASLRIKGAF